VWRRTLVGLLARKRLHAVKEREPGVIALLI
jgi:hypothetical protein